MIYKIASVIAERHLIGGRINVSIRIGAPFVPEGYPDEVRCSYQIIGVGSGSIKHAIGIDGVQALILAIRKIAAELYSSEEYVKGDIKWFSDSSDDDIGLDHLTVDRLRENSGNSGDTIPN